MSINHLLDLQHLLKETPRDLITQQCWILNKWFSILCPRLTTNIQHVMLFGHKQSPRNTEALVYNTPPFYIFVSKSLVNIIGYKVINNVKECLRAWPLALVMFKNRFNVLHQIKHI